MKLGRWRLQTLLKCSVPALWVIQRPGFGSPHDDRSSWRPPEHIGFHVAFGRRCFEADESARLSESTGLSLVTVGEDTEVMFAVEIVVPIECIVLCLHRIDDGADTSFPKRRD